MTKNTLGLPTATALAAPILVPVAALESKAGGRRPNLRLAEAYT